MQSALPPEIIDQIFSHLSHTPVRRKTLESCSHACRSFLHIARAHLFRRIAIRSCADRTRLRLLIGQAPHLTSYARELYINGFGFFMADDEVTAALEYFTNSSWHKLQEITLDNLSWSNLSPRMQRVFLNLLASKSIHHVALNSIDECPTTIVRHLSPGLKSLRINNTRFLQSFQRPSVPHLALKLDSMAIHFAASSYPEYPLDKSLLNFAKYVVDMTYLRTLKFSCNGATWPAYQQMMQDASGSLQHLYLQTSQ